jgi:phospholipase/carboxylesterase
MQDALIIGRPAEGGTTRPGLLLLFHGVGASAEDLVPLGQALASELPHSWVVSVQSPDRSDVGTGRQWFSVQGVTEANRPVRVAQAMPRFIGTVRHWQHDTGIAPRATTLLGFSQGAIMALESTQEPEPLADCVIAIAGRFAQPPRVAPSQLALHLLHGEQDRVMPAALATDAAVKWRSLGGAATLDVFSGLGHGIDGRVVRRATQLLSAPTP